MLTIVSLNFLEEINKSVEKVEVGGTVFINLIFSSQLKCSAKLGNGCETVLVEEDPANIESGEGNNCNWGNPIGTDEVLDNRPDSILPPLDGSLEVFNVELHEQDGEWGVSLELCLVECLTWGVASIFFRGCSCRRLLGRYYTNESKDECDLQEFHI